MARPKQLPSFDQSVRGLGLPSSVVEAIEQMQQHMKALYQGDAFANYGRSILSGGIGGGGTGPGGEIPGEEDERPDYTPPPAPRNLTAQGGYRDILLRWEPDNDRRIGYTEVLRASVNNPGVATVVGTTSGNIFPDYGLNGQTFYYWVRNVNKWDSSIKSPLNSAQGTLASTAPDVEYLLDLLTGNGPEQPFYAIATTQVIDGVTIPPGVYMKSLYARDAIVKTFRAGLAVIDSASIISLTADKIEANSLVARLGQFTTGQFQTIFANKAFITSANIGDGQITTAKIGNYIQSNNFNGNEANTGTAGWYIGKSGVAHFNNVNVRGTVTGSTINGSTINGSTINGTTVNASVVYGSTVVAGVVRSGDNSIALDLNATGGALAFRAGLTAAYYGPLLGWHYPVEITADGSAFFGRAVLAPRTPIASSGGYAIPVQDRPAYDGATQVTRMHEVGSFLVDTGYSDPIGWAAGFSAAELYSARGNATRFRFGYNDLALVPPGVRIGNWALAFTPTWVASQVGIGAAGEHTSVPPAIASRIYLLVQAYYQMNPISFPYYSVSLEEINWSLYRT